MGKDDDQIHLLAKDDPGQRSYVSAECEFRNILLKFILFGSIIDWGD